MTPRPGAVYTAAELRAMLNETRRALKEVATLYFLVGMCCGSLASWALKWALDWWWP